MLKILAIILLGSLYLFSFVSCSSLGKSDERDYQRDVKYFSDRAEFYSGINNVFQMHGTVLNSKILNGQANKKARAFSWDDEQLNEERRKINDTLNRETKVFLSFYSPENKINNLDSPSSIWRVFLDVNNKRYIGSVSTFVGFANEAALFYPYHTIFAKAYMVTFPVPISEIQNSPMKLTITGTVGSDTIQFKALN